MDKILIHPTNKIEYDVPVSKSIYHRALILSSFKDKEIDLIGKVESEDIKATIDCLNLLGADIKETEYGVHVRPIKNIDYSNTLDCRDSASTYRFLKEVLPKAKLTGTPNLLKRIDNNKTSQIYTGKMLRKEIFKEDFKYELPNVSKAYIDITNKVIEDFRTVKDEYVIEKDFSSAALFLVLGAIIGETKVKGLNANSIQGDRRILDILKDVGALVETSDEYIRVRRKDIKSIVIDGSKTPDLVPILAILLSYGDSISEIDNIGYLKYKESDRLLSTVDMINSLHGEAYKFDDKIVIVGKKLSGGTVKSYKDHRIVMAASIASFMIDDEVCIKDYECVSKSYETFFDNF